MAISSVRQESILGVGGESRRGEGVDYTSTMDMDAGSNLIGASPCYVLSNLQVIFWSPWSRAKTCLSSSTSIRSAPTVTQCLHCNWTTDAGDAFDRQVKSDPSSYDRPSVRQTLTAEIHIFDYREADLPQAADSELQIAHLTVLEQL